MHWKRKNESSHIDGIAVDWRHGEKYCYMYVTDFVSSSSQEACIGSLLVGRADEVVFNAKNATNFGASISTNPFVF